MSKASIVTIGNEILSGATVNTNAAYLAERLLSIGIFVVGGHTVEDDVDAIVRALRFAADEAEIVIVTGGLGPTSDDVTREALAKFFDVELHLEKELLEKIESFFSRRGLQMPANNKKQAYLPAGTEALDNNIGSAPGIKAKKDGKIIFALPGVPAEMKTMFEKSVLGELKKAVEESTGPVTVVRKVNCFGAGESTIAEMLGGLCERGRNPEINFTASFGIITLHITAKAENKVIAELMAEKDAKMLTEKLGDLVFGTGEQSLAEIVGAKLGELKKTIAVAESCTGGLLAKMLTDIPGASNYFTYGWITYSNDAKTNELGVSVELIEKYGAVSEDVVQAMAKGARSKAKTDIAIAITGIAGPTGGSEQKPVGLVYICVDSHLKNATKGIILPGDRSSIRLRAANTALNMLRYALQKLTQ